MKVITSNAIYWRHVFPTSGELEHFTLFALPSPGLSHTHHSKKYHVLTLLICRSIPTINIEVSLNGTLAVIYQKISPGILPSTFQESDKSICRNNLLIATGTLSSSCACWFLQQKQHTGDLED